MFRVRFVVVCKGGAAVRGQRWVRGAVVMVVLALGVAGCSFVGGGQKPEPAAVVDAYLSALSRSDVTAAAAGTDDPAAAARSLQAVLDGLEPTSSEFTAEYVNETSASVAQFSYRTDWNLGPGRSWSYSATGQLRSGEQGWRIVWDPTVVHPQLQTGQTLERNRVSGSSAGVLDRQGRPIMAPQTVTLVNITPGTTAADIGKLAAALNPYDPTITPDSLSQQLSTTPAGETTTVITLRERDAIAVQTRLQAVPGVQLVQQGRLLSVDPATTPAALGGLQEVWQATRDETAGWRVSIREADGSLGANLAGGEAAAAADVQTTLDTDIQAAAQQALAGVPQQAALVAIQPSTGQVLAVAQNPTADAQGPIALTGLYPPGSTFKVVTTTAALQAGVATADTVLPCPGTENIEGRQIPNESMFDLGAVPLHTAFARSCNTTMARLAVGLPADALHRSGLQLGLGVDYTTPGLTTVTGKVPVANEPAQRVESAIGQGTVVASPFGMALATAAVAAGRLPTPMFLLGEPGTADQTPPPVPPEVTKAVRAMMRETVTDGTATKINDIPGLQGKTGTAQYGDGTHSHGWFVGIDGDLAFAVLVVGGESSAPAVAAVGRFLRAAPDAVPR